MILKTNPYDRPSYSQILSHPFMNQEVAIPKTIKPECLYNDPTPEYLEELEKVKNENFGQFANKLGINKG